jgi:hypothetical protein
MRLSLFYLSAICLSIVGSAQRAEAQNYPWCAYYSSGDDGGGTNCGFITFNCQPNTQFVPPPGPHPAIRVQRRYPH